MLPKALQNVGFNKLLNPTPNCIRVHPHEPGRASERDAKLACFPVRHQEHVHSDQPAFASELGYGAILEKCPPAATQFGLPVLFLVPVAHAQTLPQLVVFISANSGTSEASSNSWYLPKNQSCTSDISPCRIFFAFN